jgi:hypothetical protein
VSGGTGTGTPAVASTSQTVATLTGAPFLLERISEPVAEPVTLAEAKIHLRTFASDTSEDNLISQLITSARQWAEEYTGRALVDQQWRVTVNGRSPSVIEPAPAWGNVPAFSAAGWGWWQRHHEILLRKSPVIALTLFVTADSTGAETTVDAATYALTEPDSRQPRILPLDGSTWNNAALKVEFRAGYATIAGSPVLASDLAAIPARFKQAILLHAEAHYDRDERMMQTLLTAAENLLKPERIELSMA